MVATSARHRRLDTGGQKPRRSRTGAAHATIGCAVCTKRMPATTRTRQSRPTSPGRPTAATTSNAAAARALEWAEMFYGPRGGVWDGADERGPNPESGGELEEA